MMGAWGAGTFDADSARDFLADKVGRWEKSIGKLIAGKVPREFAALELEPGVDAAEACAMPLVEVMIVVAERLDPDYLPSSETIERWRSDYLALFDREMVGNDVDIEDATERRAAINNTFSRLRTVIDSNAKNSAD